MDCMALAGHPSTSSRRAGLWRQAALFGAAYFLCAEASNLLSVRHGVFMTFWLPAGLYVGVLLLNPTRDWPWLCLAAFPANLAFDLIHGTPLIPILIFYFANTLQSVTGAWLVRRFVAERPTMATLKEFIGLMGFAALFSTMLGATVTAAMLVHFGMSQSFMQSWKLVWGDCAMAVLVFTPFLLTWFSRQNPTRNLLAPPKKIAEAVLLFLGLSAYLWYLLAVETGVMSPNKSLGIPFLLWAGLRFGTHGATATVLFLSLALSFFTTRFCSGLTPAQVSSGEYIFILQMLLAMMTVVALIPAIVLGERNRTLAELRESEEKFSKAFRASPDGICITELETGRFLEVNDGYCKLFQFTREELVGRTAVELGIFADPDARKHFLDAVLAQGSVRDMEFITRRSDGQTRLVQASTERMELGTKQCIVSVIHDITNRKRAEELTHMQMQVLEMLSGGRSLPEALGMLLRLIESQSPEMLCSILLLDVDGIHIRHGAAPSLPADYLKAIDGAAIGPNAGSCGMAAFERKAVFVADIESDPLWADYKKFALPHGLRACWSTPIFDESKNVLGTFAIYYRHKELPGGWHLRLIAMATHTAAICIIKHRTEAERQQAVSREHQARVEYTFQLIASQEAERARIARELHDSLGQNLLLIKNHALLARANDNAAASTRLEEISALISQAITEVRQISHDLHPYQLDHLGLTRALAAMIDSAAEASGIAFERKLDSVDAIFSMEAAINLYRIVQETVSNVLKHSRAKKVSIKLECDVREVQLRIADDGVGFNVPENGNGGKGLGLKNIAERTRILNGVLKIDSQPGCGTRIEVTIPIAEAA